MTGPASLRRWATPRQAELLDALEQHGSARAAAAVLGIHHSNFGRVKTSAAGSYRPGAGRLNGWPLVAEGIVWGVVIGWAFWRLPLYVRVALRWGRRASRRWDMWRRGLL